MNPSIFSAQWGGPVARALIDCGCVSVRTDEPFRLPSGWSSPVYMDCRRVISFPAVRQEIVKAGIAMLREHGGLEGITRVVGGESSGIALAAWIADALDLPMAYVRKRSTAERQIEGIVQPDDRVLLVDDLMAAGHSKVRFCRALRDSGALVRDAFVVFSYGTFPVPAELSASRVRVHALATWQDILAVAKERGDFTRSVLDELQAFLDDPVAWSGDHGGAGEALNVVDAI